jgi:hypothetical protein
MMTKEEFIQGYCKNSNIDREFFDRYFAAEECDCGDEKCKGWSTIRKYAKPACKCKSMAQQINGDGCDECNPRAHVRIMEDTIEELKEDIEELEKNLKEAVMLLKTHQDPCAPRHEAVDRFLAKMKEMEQ